MIKTINRTIFSLLVLLILSSCGDDKKDKKKVFQSPIYSQSTSSKQAQPVDAKYRWDDYVAFHSEGFISKKDRISISFLSPIVTAGKVGQSAQDLIKIEPMIDASITYVSPREIQIIPTEALVSGQSYQVTVATGQLIGFPKELQQYQFDFSVIKQAFELLIDGLTANEAGDSLTIDGRLTTADRVDAEALEKMLTARYSQQAVKLDWQHDSSAKIHLFTVKNLARHKNSEILTLVWDGNNIGVADVGERHIEIPAIGDFKIANIRAVQTDRQQIEISFTDKLLASQNLNGLIHLGSNRFTARIEGNMIKVYPDGIFQGEITLIIDQAIKNKDAFKLGKTMTKTLLFLSEKPQVKFVGKGVILPNTKQLTVPFEAVNVDSVQVTAFQIYANNMGQFLQSNPLNGSYDSYRVGRALWRKRIALSNPVQDSWNRYQLDVSELLNNHPGSLFRITLSINRSNSIYSCSDQENTVPVPPEPPLISQEEMDDEGSNWDFADSYYNSANIKWAQRKNPCKDAYFEYAKNIKGSRNFMASNIGLIVKRGSDKKLLIATTNLQTGQPMAGVDIEIYNYQNQLLADTKSDLNALVSIALPSTPFYVKAYKNNQVGYLKLSSGQVLPTSHFDVGGLNVNKGIKGYLYGERGVWRPGDDIYLTFVLQDLNDRIPAAHPVTLDFFNPKGQLISSTTNNNPVDDFYAFKIATQDNAMTGNWKVIAKLGGAHFQKRIKIEAVIPNRLKVALTSNDNPLLGFKMPISGNLFSQWLHGAKASNLKADINVKFRATKTKFSQFTDYQFDDPARQFLAEKQEVYSNYLDEEGNMGFQTMLRPKGKPAGMLNAFFTSRVFEKGGAFSSETQMVPYHPYRNYVGVKLPQGDSKRNMLLTDKSHRVSIATLDAFGKKVSLKDLEVTLYKIDWKWWWDKSGESLAKYVSAYRSAPIEMAKISTQNGVGEWQFEIKYPQWGRYMVRVCDPQDGHCTGQVFYIDWPGWAGRAKDQKGIGAAVINLSSDKEQYEVGEVATINLPASKQGYGLVTIENGSRIIDRYWVELTAKNRQVTVDLTADMSPSIYLSLSLIQPHEGKNNDLPIRLFGILPIKVVDPQTELKPIIKVADEFAPQSTAQIDVSEIDGKAMTYTLAIVDEGLLGLTRYRTPALRAYFYQKEALGIKTWDMFDQVVGAYGGELERILSLGGDESLDADDSSAKKKRFPPVVRVLGPFHLNVGEIKHHSVAIPQYLGAVRVMLVAGHQGAYGVAKKSVLVRQSVNLLATVPRVVGPLEEVTIPVAVFVNEQALGDVTISVEHDDHFEWLDAGPITLNFEQPGDKLGLLKFKVSSKLGQGRLKFTARQGEFKSEQEIYIDIRSANPKTYRQTKTIIAAGKKWKTEYTPHGMPMTNSAVLEFSRVPPLNLESRLGYLIHYPHGCVEQTTSSVFPQLFLSDLVSLESDQADEVENNVAKGIDRLRSFQITSGGFSYWPGQSQAHIWGTNYVGEFLLAAKNKGYDVPASMLSAWVDFQRTAASSWTTGDDLVQAYRLYLLAIAGEPAIGSMNRLREKTSLSDISRWYLAAAYQKIGQSGAAKSLVSHLSLQAESYNQVGINLNSQLRDEAIMLQSLLLLNNKKGVDQLVKKISERLSSSRWLGTQETAMALNAMSAYIKGADITGSQQDKIKVAYKLGDQAAELVASDKPIWKSKIKVTDSQPMPIVINNQSGGDLYVTLHAEGIPKPGNEKAVQHGLALSVNYLSSDGYAADAGRLVQGNDMTIKVTVRNDSKRDFKYLALTQILPSGWEIHHPTDAPQATRDPLQYQDIRDDRVLTYFELKKGQQKEFEITINATYLGRYYLPAFSLVAMYDASQYARSKGFWVEVVEQN